MKLRNYLYATAFAAFMVTTGSCTSAGSNSAKEKQNRTFSKIL